MNIDELKFPYGIHLHFKFGQTEEEKIGRKLSTSLEISKDRYTTLKDKVTSIVLKALNDKKASYIQLDKMVDEAAQECRTIPELTFVMYALGTILEQEKAKREKQKKRGSSGLGGLPGLIIAMGSIPKGSISPEEGGEDEDPIAKAMRESKKINGDWNKPKEDNAGEEW